MADTYVYAGSFDTDLSRRIRVQIPDGFRRVWSGCTKPGDLYLNRLALLDGREQWEPVECAETGDEFWDRVNNSAESFMCLIRKGESTKGGCEHCQARAALREGYRYCVFCIRQFVRPPAEA